MPVVYNILKRPGGTAPTLARVTVELAGEDGARVVGYVDGYAIEGHHNPDVTTALPVTASAATDSLTCVGHGLASGQVIAFVNTGGALPAPLVAGTVYFVVNATTDTFQVSATEGGSAVNLTDAGTGTHTLQPGMWSETLEAAADIDPAGSRWKATEIVHGVRSVSYLEVTASANPLLVEDILDEAPGALPAGPLAAEIARATAAEADLQNQVDDANADIATNATAIATNATAIANHLADTDDAHDASAVSFTPTGNITSTTVQDAIVELAVEGTDLVLRNPMHLRRWRDARTNALASQPVITVVGDSITAGAKAHDLSTAIATAAEMETARYLGYAGILRDRFDQAFAYGGEGFIFGAPYTIDSTYYEYRAANTGSGTPLSGGAGTLGVGPFNGITLTSGQQITYTTDQPCTRIDILWGYTTSPLTAAFTYTVDGGAPITADMTGAVANGVYAETISGLADTTHVVVISGPATKRADIGGLVCTRPGTGGVVVNGVGQSGARISGVVGGNFTTGAPATTNLLNLVPTLDLTNTDLAIIMIGYNDAQSHDDATTFKATIQATCDYIVGLGACVLLVPDPRGNLNATDLAFLDSYYTKMQEVSDATDHVAYTDLLPIWPDYATAVATGIIADTSVHPNSTGHRLIGEGLYHLLSGQPA